MWRFKLLTLALGILAASTAAHAQQAGSASIRGIVVDEQKGVLPGVTVVATHQESGVFRQTVSGPEGTYSLVGLVPGPYIVSAELSGFKKMTQRDVVLAIGVTQTVDVRLEVGQLAESVTVTASSPVVDFTSAQVKGNVGAGDLKDLPSTNRDFVGFVSMVPGVQYNPVASGSSNVNINGQTSSQVTYLVDGGSNNDDFRGGSTGGQVRNAIESIQEFQVITNQFDAEYGRTTGGVVNAIMKQGSNRLRGSAFAFYTNAAMTAEDYFVESSNGAVAKPDTKKYQWGFTVGGPVIRDKMHFFSSFERVKNSLGATNIYPDRPDLSFSGTSNFNFYNFMNRIDHQVNANNTYGIRWLTEHQPNRNQIRANSTQNTLRYDLDTDTAWIGSYNRVIGGAKLYAARVSMVSEDVPQGCECGNYEQSLRMDLELPTLRGLTFDDQHDPNGNRRTNRAYNFDQSFTWFHPGKHGDHDLKFGTQYVYGEEVRVNQNALNGIFSFPSNRVFNAADPSTYPERLQVQVPGPLDFSIHSQSVGMFAQDKWTLNQKLTLSLGVRYDFDLAAFTEQWNPLFGSETKPKVDWNNFQPRLGFAYRAGEATVIRGGYGLFYEKLWTDRFQPYFISGVYVQSFAANFPVDRADPGPSAGRLPTDPFLVNGPVVNRALLAQLYPAGTLARNSADVFLDNPDRVLPYTQQVSFGFERQLGPQISFGADYVHNAGRDQVLQYDLNPAVRANTSRTGPITRVDFMGLANQLGISPFLGRVLIRENVGKADYDALNLQIEKRYSNSWSARVAYTLGSARGNSNGLSQGSTADNNYQVLEDRHLELNQGPSDADRRHIFVTSARTELPFVPGLTISGAFRLQSGRAFSIYDSNIDADRNGLLFDPLPAGDYSGVGTGAFTVSNKGGRNGARGPAFAEFDARFGYRMKLNENRTVDFFFEVFNVSNEPNFANPSGDRRVASTFLVPTTSLGGGQPRQIQVGARLGF
jgi:Carboxypeptidase regulatory-like domain/TonB dependent receptor-like, beta-barrel/TonB-dependent Receptor Plug Domain